MLTLKGSGHIRTGRHLKTRQALAAFTGPPTAHLEMLRLGREYERLAVREAYRRRLAELWRLHFAFAAGPWRVLPPQARLRLSQVRG